MDPNTDGTPDRIRVSSISPTQEIMRDFMTEGRFYDEIDK